MGSYTDLLHQSHRYMPRMLGILLIVLTIGVYWQVQYHDFIRFDDPYYITQNRHVQEGLTTSGFIWAVKSFHSSNWHPLTWISHMIDCQLYGLNPAGHHLTNLFFHVANTLLLFLLLRESTGHLWRSFLVAIAFALHPLHVESVAWISERKDVLSTFFWILTMLSYVRYAKNKRLGRYFLSLLLFTLGLLAKPMLVTLPFVLILFDYWPLNRFHTGNHLKGKGRGMQSIVPLVREKIPFFMLSVASCIVTFIAQSQGGAIQTLKTYTITSRLANAIISYGCYIFKTIWPQDMAVFYPHSGNNFGWSSVSVIFILLVIICITVFYMAKRHPYLFTGWFWFFGTLVPVIGIVQVGMQSMADRYTYIPHIGLFIILIWGLSEIFNRSSIHRHIVALFWGVVMSLLMIVTWFQVQHWQHTIYLFRHTLDVTRDNYAAHYILARIYGDYGEVDPAFFHYVRAVEISPEFVAMMHNRYGYHLFNQERIDEAIIQFAGALDIKPDFANAHNNLGVMLAIKGQFSKAVLHFSKALNIQPDYERARKNLENVKHQQQKMPDIDVNSR